MDVEQSSCRAGCCGTSVVPMDSLLLRQFELRCNWQSLSGLSDSRPPIIPCQVRNTIDWPDFLSIRKNVKVVTGITYNGRLRYKRNGASRRAPAQRVVCSKFFPLKLELLEILLCGDNGGDGCGECIKLLRCGLQDGTGVGDPVVALLDLLACITHHLIHFLQICPVLS